MLRAAVDLESIRQFLFLANAVALEKILSDIAVERHRSPCEDHPGYIVCGRAAVVSSKIGRRRYE